MMVNGMLAGLVAITAPCAFVTAPVAVLIGAIAGVLVVVAVLFFDGRSRSTIRSAPSPCTASTAPGACSALGLFADGTYGDGWNGVPGTVKGLFYGDGSQFAAELLGVVACLLFIFTAFFIFFKLLDATIGNRVSAEVEIEGLDMPEMGTLGYPADVSHEAVGSGMGTVLKPATTAGAMRPATE